MFVYMYMYQDPIDAMHKNMMLGRKKVLEFLGPDPKPINMVVKELSKHFTTLEDTDCSWVLDKMQLTEHMEQDLTAAVQDAMLALLPSTTYHPTFEKVIYIYICIGI